MWTLCQFLSICHTLSMGHHINPILIYQKTTICFPLQFLIMTDKWSSSSLTTRTFWPYMVNTMAGDGQAIQTARALAVIVWIHLWMLFVGGWKIQWVITKILCSYWNCSKSNHFYADMKFWRYKFWWYSSLCCIIMTGPVEWYQLGSAWLWPIIADILPVIT